MIKEVKILFIVNSITNKQLMGSGAQLAVKLCNGSIVVTSPWLTHTQTSRQTAFDWLYYQSSQLT